MRIGLISDTHVPHVEKQIPTVIADVFRDVELILHGGDIYEPKVLDDLERLAPVYAALGDDDDTFEETLTDHRVKASHLLDIEGHTIYLVHQQPASLANLSGNGASSAEQGKIPDIVVFGHAHYPMISRFNGILYINPGSPTFLHYRRGPGSVGILDLDSKGGADARIFDLRLAGTPGYRGGTGYGPR